jgi:PPOX class probable F420-dependent enzyme
MTLGASVRRFLESDPPRFATIATVDPAGAPHQAVIWYLVEGDAVVVNSLEGRRWPADLRRDPRFSFVVEDGRRYVALRGRAEELPGRDRGLADISAMARRYERPADAEEMIERRFRPQQRVSFLLRPAAVTVHGDLD